MQQQAGAGRMPEVAHVLIHRGRAAQHATGVIPVQEAELAGRRLQVIAQGSGVVLALAAGAVEPYAGAHLEFLCRCGVAHRAWTSGVA